MLPFPKHLRSALLAAGLLGLAALAAAGTAQAQGKLEARYTMTLAGIPIGKGTWVIDINDNRYTAAASGVTTGLVHAFTGGQGTTAARATMKAGKLLSSIYAATISTRNRTDEIRLTVADGNVKDFRVDPPSEHDNERVPLTEESKQGVLDPMTASMLRVPGDGNLMSPDACQGTVAVFDGRLRYDLQLAFKRMDKVKAEKGYAGPVVVCAVYFSPVAGFVPTRYAIKYLSRLRDMEVWLAPIAGTRVLVPFRAEGPTPVGRAVLEATQFVSIAAPTKASINGLKVQ